MKCLASITAVRNTLSSASTTTPPTPGGFAGRSTANGNHPPPHMAASPSEAAILFALLREHNRLSFPRAKSLPVIEIDASMLQFRCSTEAQDVQLQHHRCCHRPGVHLSAVEPDLLGCPRNHRGVYEGTRRQPGARN